MDKTEELYECGLMQIKGSAYEDILAILWKNGYTTEVRTVPKVNVNHEFLTHIIKYWKCEKSSDNTYQE